MSLKRHNNEERRAQLKSIKMFWKVEVGVVEWQAGFWNLPHLGLAIIAYIQRHEIAQVNCRLALLAG